MSDIIAATSDFDVKLWIAKERIEEWYEHHSGKVAINFSGGKDSTVLRHLVLSMYPDVESMFSNTGLEYPEIVAFVKSEQAKSKRGKIVIYRPKTTFRQSILDDGFPLVSKKVAEMVSRLRKPKTDKNANTHRLYLTGIKMDGTYSKGSKLSEKWKILIDAPFKTTNKCCDTLKKEPFKRYKKDTGFAPFVGVMKSEGGQRAMLNECNSFEGKTPMSRPLLPWSEEDIWEYIKRFDVDYCEIYDDRVVNGVEVKGETRTGCMFCAFGAHLEVGTNRFQRMYYSHPKQWNYCINKLGMAEALDFIGVAYYPEGLDPKLEHQPDMFDEL